MRRTYASDASPGGPAPPSPAGRRGGGRSRSPRSPLVPRDTRERMAERDRHIEQVRVGCLNQSLGCQAPSSRQSRRKNAADQP